MFARGVFSFYPPRLYASSCFPSKPFVSPTCKIAVRNSFVSPTYAKTGGCTPPKMSARRHFLSLLSQSPSSALLLFKRLRTLSLSVSSLSPTLPISSVLFAQKPGVHPLGPTNPRLWTVDCRLPSPHSPAIHNPVTGPSPIVLPLLSQWTPVRGPTHTPCLPSTRGLRYTSTDAIRPARSAHETRTDY